MVPSLPLLSCESSVPVKENPDRKKNHFCDKLKWVIHLIWYKGYHVLIDLRYMFCKLAKFLEFYCVRYFHED